MAKKPAKKSSKETEDGRYLYLRKFRGKNAETVGKYPEKVAKNRAFRLIDCTVQALIQFPTVSSLRHKVLTGMPKHVADFYGSFIGEVKTAVRTQDFSKLSSLIEGLKTLSKDKGFQDLIKLQVPAAAGAATNAAVEKKRLIRLADGTGIDALSPLVESEFFKQETARIENDRIGNPRMDLLISLTKTAEEFAALKAQDPSLLSAESHDWETVTRFRQICMARWEDEVPPSIGELQRQAEALGRVFRPGKRGRKKKI